jgi:hypothetical protein
MQRKNKHPDLVNDIAFAIQNLSRRINEGRHKSTFAEPPEMKKAEPA